MVELEIECCGGRASRSHRNLHCRLGMRNGIFANFSEKNENGIHKNPKLPEKTNQIG